MINITLSKALSVFARELGCGGFDDREILIDEVTRAIEWLLANGGGDILREWVVTVRDGRFTFPRDLETPIKFKFTRHAKGGFGVFHSSYYSYGSQGISNCCGYFDWSVNIEVRANRVVTEYYPPKCGVRLIATTKDLRDISNEARIIVGGEQRGMPIVTTHNGYKVSGELLKVYAEDDPDKKYSAYKFDAIKTIVKDRTCDYVTLSGIDESGDMYFLSHYHPDDETPSYTEGEVYGCPCWNAFGLGHFTTSCDYSLHILGRVNPSIVYIRDEDILPITSLDILKLLALRARYDNSGEFDTTDKIENRLRSLILKQTAYQQKASNKLSVSLGASGFTYSNI